MARSAALVLILFALLPWTAPFPTLDIAPSGDDRPAFDAPKSKASDDYVITVAAGGRIRELCPAAAEVPRLITLPRPATASNRPPLRI